jgi:hypothetical protein
MSNVRERTWAGIFDFVTVSKSSEILETTKKIKNLSNEIIKKKIHTFVSYPVLYLLAA